MGNVERKRDTLFFGPGGSLHVRESGLARRGGLKSAADLELVLVGCEQIVQFGGIGELHFEEPPTRIGFGIDQARIVDEGFVDGRDRAAYGGVDIARGFDRFNDSADLTRLERSPDLGEFHEDDIGQFLLSVIGDAEKGGVAFDPDPFMALGVFQCGGNGGHKQQGDM